MTVFNFVFKRYFKRPSSIFFLLILPIALVFLPMGEWPPIPLGFQYYGILLLFISVKLTSIIMIDRENKVLLRIGVAPITHFQYLLENLLAYGIILIGLNMIVVIMGSIVYRESFNYYLLLFIIYSFFSMTALGFSLAWYSLFQNKDTATSILSGVIMLMAMVGGVLWPIQIMPVILQRLAMLLPTYWLGQSITFLAFRAPISEQIIPLTMMLIFSILFLIVGSRRKII
ncbi:MAG: ABC transporter permease [Tissierella sp.]|nr:ABC transporter permease [Tissierella sp.]